MEDIIITLRYSVNLDRGVVKQRLPVDFGTGDKEAHRIILTACRNDGAVDLTGAGVLAYVNRNDGTSVIVDGSVVNGKAIVLLPEAAYAVNGAVSVVVKLTMDGSRTTALWLDGHINRSSNETLVDPGGLLPGLEELLAEIDNMRTATDEATQAAEDAQNKINESAENAETAISQSAINAQQSIAANRREAEAAIHEAREAVILAAEKSAPAIIPVLSGLLPSAADAAERPFLSLRAFGRSTQNGTPSPEKPAVIQNPGSTGTLTISVMGENQFQGGSVTLNVGHGLHAIPVPYGGNYVDVTGQMWLADEIDANTAVIFRRIGVRTITNATKSSNPNYNVYNVSTDDWNRATGDDVRLMLSHYPYNGTSTGSSALKSDVAMLNSGIGSLYLGHKSIGTADAYNAWLAEQEAAGTPVTVLYPLEAPVEEPMTDEEADASKALHSIYPVTTINAGGAWIVAQYIADTKIYIDNQISAIAARMINV